MIYALEWYDVPKKEYGYMAEYHPYLTKGDHFRLSHLNTEHFGTQCVIMCLFTLVSNRYLLSKVKSKFG